MTTSEDLAEPQGAAEDSEARFRRAGEKASEVKRVAYESYSRAADVVRQRAAELDDALHKHHTSTQVVERAREALAVAIHVKDLAEHEHVAADQNWREWLDEHRARQEDERLHRQEGIAHSAKQAAWASALATALAGLVTFWQVFGSAIRAAVHR